MALPYLNLYIGDVKKDTDLLSPAAFGGYMRLLFKMHESPERGVVSYTLTQLTRVFGTATTDETIAILNEIIDPAYNVVTYIENGEKHCIINRRMKRESKISEVRSEAGKKGAAKTNTKSKNVDGIADMGTSANEPATHSANVVANDSPNNPTDNSTNEITNPGQNYNNNTGINNNSNDAKGGPGGSMNDGARVMLVPGLALIWKSYPEKSDYILSKEVDYPALLEIAQNIGQILNLTEITTLNAIDEIKKTFKLIVNFILKDTLFKDFQLSQVAKYFNTITSKMKSQHEQRKLTINNPPKLSIIDSNINADQGAKEILKQKYGS